MAGNLYRHLKQNLGPVLVSFYFFVGAIVNRENKGNGNIPALVIKFGHIDFKYRGRVIVPVHIEITDPAMQNSGYYGRN